MTEADVTFLTNDTLMTCLILVGPSVAASLCVGLLISIFQAVTSIQEQTLSFAPRILAVGLVISITLAWSLETAMAFTKRMFLFYLELGS